MRLFIGIPLGNQAQEQLTAHYKLLKGVKTVKKENLHITLQFIGETDESMVPEISAAIDKAAGDFRAFDFSSTRISAFPIVTCARVIWANVDEGSGAVKKLFKNLEQALLNIPHEKEDRAFIPHITLARSKQGADISGIASSEKFIITSKASAVVLYSSVLEDAGPVYTKVYEKTLV
jgi:2'-5' RNA ligase